MTGADGTPHTIGMGLERIIWRSTLMRRHDPAELRASLEFVEVDPPWTFRLLEHRNEVCERAIAKYRESQQAKVRPEVQALMGGIGDGPDGPTRGAAA